MAVIFLEFSFHVLQFISFLLITSLVNTQNIVVFQPSFLVTSGPSANVLLLGNTSQISFILRKVNRQNSKGSNESCVAEETQWTLTREHLGNAAVQVRLKLERSLRLCGLNETDLDCCPRRLCVLEAIQVAACLSDVLQTSVTIQARIYARIFPTLSGPDNKTIITNQVYQPLGSCPCDLTLRKCDIRCCCDKDCSPDDVELFRSQCFKGPFGGQVSSAPDFQCSSQAAKNSPDWFPFLCVTSPPENNPYLGLFYQGDKIVPTRGPSFNTPALPAPVPTTMYHQGSPIFTIDDQYFTIPQLVLGRCVKNSPVAFLKNFKAECVTPLQSCPVETPLLTTLTDLMIQVKNGQGGVINVNVVDTGTKDFTDFGSSTTTSVSPVVCENVTTALDYKFHWEGNDITNITVVRTVATFSLHDSVMLTTRYSAEFLKGVLKDEPKSGNPGYQTGKPVIVGNVNMLENETDVVQRSSLSIFNPVSDGLCSAVEKKPVLFGENSTSGCMFPASSLNLSQCSRLRGAVVSFLESLVDVTLVARAGNPDYINVTNWSNISFVTLNASTTEESTNCSCSGIPTHLEIHIWSSVTGWIDGHPQKEISAMQVNTHLSTWTLDCEGGDVALCLNPTETQLFPVTSSVTFIDILGNTRPLKTRFQINFTEYDCSRNDICWPELAFPVTRFYAGELYYQALAKGLILVFFFIVVSLLGTPWRQIRQAWTSACL
ncbi:tectonic-2 isoform X1 [Synchiropus splendidus]|uniref:tectonic-2 isoform X1 n=1 Tax=Synchiropus splendidus TaxID=270530 RepID=UPI00237E7E7E|nr:tectonic-2 isoform X1 [Synchiropus splendidus]